MMRKCIQLAFFSNSRLITWLTYIDLVCSHDSNQPSIEIEYSSRVVEKIDNLWQYLFLFADFAVTLIDYFFSGQIHRKNSPGINK